MLLIDPPNPGSRFKNPPLGLAYLASSILKSGFETSILECQYIKDYKLKLTKEIEKWNFVGISVAHLGLVKSAKKTARFIRQHYPDKTIVMGGAFPTSMWNNLIPDYADIVVIGEGEDTIIEILKEIPYEQIAGIAYDKGEKVKRQKGKSEICLTPSRPFIKDLDILPFPAWSHLTQRNKYYAFLSKYPFATMITSRGCPYNCIFCTKTVHGKEVRLRSLENIMEEIKYLKNNFNIKHIQFVDDIFDLSPERVKKICKLIINETYNKKIVFDVIGITHPDKDDEEMFNFMGKANFKWLAFGIETGTQKISDKIGKRIDLAKVAQSIKWANKYGITTTVFFILGLPFDTVETVNTTIKFAKTIPADIATFRIALPLPGTEMFDMIQAGGNTLNNSADGFVTNIGGIAMFETKELKKEILEKLCRKSYNEFYFRPVQILRVFRHIIIRGIMLRDLDMLIKYLINLLRRGTLSGWQG